MSTSSDKSATRPVRRTLNLASTPDSPLDRITSLYGEKDLPHNISSVLDRYLVMLHRAIPRFSDREICVVIDALGDSWEPTPTNVSQIPREVLSAIITDRLDVKWGIDTDKFSSRLDRTSFYERVALGEITAAYWRMATPDSRPQDIISQIKKLLRPASSPITPTSRPRRISAQLFEENPPAATGQSDSEDANTNDADTDTNPDTDRLNTNGAADPDPHADGSATITSNIGADHTGEADDPDPDAEPDHVDTITSDTGADYTGEADDPDGNGAATGADQPAASDSPQDPLL